MSESTARTPGPIRTVKRFASAAEADREDLAYWLRMPEAERVLEVWRLSVEL